MASHRLSRVREQLLRELGDIVQHLRDPRLGFVTVMDVELSSDLRNATVYVSALGDSEAQQRAMEALDRALGHIRREVARRLGLRHVPEFAVEYDDTSERAARVSALIDRIPRRDGAPERPTDGTGPEPPSGG